MEIIRQMKNSSNAAGGTLATNNTSSMKSLINPQQQQQQQQHSYYGNDSSSMLCTAAFPAQMLQTTTSCLDCTANKSTTACCAQWQSTFSTPANCCALPTNPFDSSYGCCSNFNSNYHSTAINNNCNMLAGNVVHHNFITTEYEQSMDDVAYEYQEPEENFISIDDAKIKGFLLKMGQQQAQQAAQPQTQPQQQQQPIAATRSIVYEVIDLDNAEERKKLQRLKCEAEADNRLKQQQKQQEAQQMQQQQQQPNETNQFNKVIAQIDLSEHSSNDSNKSLQAHSEHDGTEFDESDESALPLAAVAVSCELACDDDDDGEVEPIGKSDVVIIPSDDEIDDAEEFEDISDSIDEQEQGVELLYADLEQQKDQRQFYECYLCGKKVQSSYNLRRHMMIHTGERPFGCDMCERRFREFSDLKKHRRRHMHEPNFLCMICRVKKPREQDPTRCIDCDTRNDALATITVASTKETVELKSSYSCNTIKTTIATTENSRVKSITTTTATITATSNTANNNTSNKTAASMQLLNSLSQQGISVRKQFACPLCKRPFGTRHNLKRHFMIHTGEKPFSCSKCRKPFREYSTLKKHMVTHQRDRLYKCLSCPAKFVDFLDYTAHKQTHLSSDDNAQTQKKQRLNEDSSCDSIEDEEDDETTEDWLECCECSKRFTDIDAYTEHLREHEAEQEFLYECYVCKKTFEERDKLLLHMSEHDR